jgi:hypothetical protein
LQQGLHRQRPLIVDLAVKAARSFAKLVKSERAALLSPLSTVGFVSGIGVLQ